MVLEGVNKTLFNWAIDSKIIGTICRVDETFKSDLTTALENDPRKRCSASIKLSEQFWRHFQELGVSPNFDLLSVAEHDRLFFDGYRDHTAHSFKVYLTGLWIYEKNDEIRKKFFEKGIDEHRFKITWTATALWHDIGYLFENDKIGKRDSWWQYIQDEINGQYKQPISKILGNSLLSAAAENRFYRTARITIPTLDNIPGIEQDQHLFELLKPAGNMSGLTSVTDVNVIEKLYNYIKSEPTQGQDRKPYKDHGIFGALLLLHLWEQYKLLLKDVKLKSSSYTNLSAEVITKITNLLEMVEKSELFIVEAAQAIALHNITKDLPTDELMSCGVDIEKFAISADDCYKQYVAQPFAFLLKLVDELQMWDRPKYDSPQLNENMLHGKDMEIVVHKNFIGIWLQDDDDSYKKLEHPNTQYSVLKKKLNNCVQIAALLKPLRASQVYSLVPSLTEIDHAKLELVGVFYNDSTRELITQIKDKYQCNVHVLLHNRSDYFEFLQPNGSCVRLEDKKMLGFAKGNYQKQVSDIFINGSGKKTGFALITTDFGSIGYLVLENMVQDPLEELIADRGKTSRLDDYGMMYGALILQSFQKLVENGNTLGELTKIDDVRRELNKYIPFGYNENCISVFLDIRGLSKLLSNDNETIKQYSLQFIDKFSFSVQTISAEHFGIISSHFGGGMLIIFNQVVREQLSLSCFRASCAIHKIRESFHSLITSTFKNYASIVATFIDIGIGASAGTIFFSTFGRNTCVYYTGVGEKISYAKKIENISGRENVAVKHVSQSVPSIVDGASLPETDTHLETGNHSCKGKIFVSAKVYENCQDAPKCVKWQAVNVEIPHDDKKHILYYLSNINKNECPLKGEKKCLCCLN